MLSVKKKRKGNDGYLYIWHVVKTFHMLDRIAPILEHKATGSNGLPQLMLTRVFDLISSLDRCSLRAISHEIIFFTWKSFLIRTSMTSMWS